MDDHQQNSFGIDEVTHEKRTIQYFLCFFDEKIDVLTLFCT